MGSVAAPLASLRDVAYGRRSVWCGEHCNIHHYGRITPSYEGGVCLHGVGARVLSNHIHHSGTSGVGGSMGVYLDNCLSGNTVEDNFFEHVTSAIVINGGRDNDIRRNVFKDCAPAISVSALGMDTTPPGILASWASPTCLPQRS